MSNYKLIGQNYTPPDLIAKITGAAKYAEDYRADGMLWCRLLCSPMPHARVRRLDVSAALKMPGVKAILTADDLPAPPTGGGPFGPPPGPPPVVAGTPGAPSAEGRGQGPAGGRGRRGEQAAGERGQPAGALGGRGRGGLREQAVDEHGQPLEIPEGRGRGRGLPEQAVDEHGQPLEGRAGGPPAAVGGPGRSAQAEEGRGPAPGAGARGGAGLAPAGPQMKPERALTMEPRYAGEPILAVAAVDEETAVAAIEAIEIEFEPLPVRGRSTGEPAPGRPERQPRR